MRNCIASLFLAPSLAFASGYAVLNTSPRDLGLCASAVAAQRDAGAAFALPAALARIAGPSARAGGGAVNVFDAWKDPNPGATEPPLELILRAAVLHAVAMADASIGRHVRRDRGRLVHSVIARHPGIGCF